MGIHTPKYGVLPHQTLKDMVSAGYLSGVSEKNIRPGSIDLTLSKEAYVVSGIFQPRINETIKELLPKIGAVSHDLSKPLEANKIYLIRLKEYFSLPESVYGYANPKSTSGRLDMHVRLLADRIPRYDSLYKGFVGELWISVTPKSFPILLSEDQSLNQINLFNADTRLSDLELGIAFG